MIPLRPNRINVYNVPTFERINVEPGDLIGWYYPRGQVGLVYHSCSADYENRTVYSTSVNGLDDLVEGLQVETTVLVPCRTYSIVATVSKGTWISHYCTSQGLQGIHY